MEALEHRGLRPTESERLRCIDAMLCCLASGLRHFLLAVPINRSSHALRAAMGPGMSMEGVVPGTDGSSSEDGGGRRGRRIREAQEEGAQMHRELHSLNVGGWPHS